MLDTPTKVFVKGTAGPGISAMTTDMPDGLQIGDMVLAFVFGGCADQFNLDGFTGHAPIVADDAGWTEVTQGGFALSSTGLTDPGILLAVFSFVVESTPAPTTATFSSADLASYAVALVRVSNVAEIDNVSAVTLGTAATPSTVTVPSVNAVADNSLLFYAVCGAYVDFNELRVPPGSMTMIANVGLTNAWGSYLAVFAQGVDTGATGTRATTVNSDNPGDPLINPPQPVGVMLTVHLNGACADGTCFVVGTDKLYTVFNPP